MRKKIIFSSLYAAFLLIIFPAIPAMEFNTIFEDKDSYLFEKIRGIDIAELRMDLNGGFGLYELLLAFLLLLYIELGIIFNRSFTFLLLLITILYEIGVRLGLIEPDNYSNFNYI